MQDELEGYKFFPYDTHLSLCINFLFINLYTYKYLIYALNTCTMFECVIFVQFARFKQGHISLDKIITLHMVLCPTYENQIFIMTVLYVT